MSDGCDMTGHGGHGSMFGRQYRWLYIKRGIAAAAWLLTSGTACGRRRQRMAVGVTWRRARRTQKGGIDGSVRQLHLR